MKLYSYCLRYDDGAAPNPLWGVCTLAICKPRIRKAAEVDDWIVGLGATRSPIGDISKCVVYAMKISNKLTFSQYDHLCRSKYPDKIPDFKSDDYRRRVGDCIYDFILGDPPSLRNGIHTEQNRSRDLSGQYVLLSNFFFYFGDHPVKLPDDLLDITHQTQGHKSTANQPCLVNFIQWTSNWKYEPNKLYGEPQLKAALFADPCMRSKCSSRDLTEDEEDRLEQLQPPVSTFFSLNEAQRRVVHITLCEMALEKWRAFAQRNPGINYTDCVVGLSHSVELTLPEEALESVKQAKDVADVTNRYMEPIGH